MKMTSELFIKQKSWYNFVSFLTEQTLPWFSKPVAEIAVITFGSSWSKNPRVKKPPASGSPFFQSWVSLPSTKTSQMTKLP